MATPAPDSIKANADPAAPRTPVASASRFVSWADRLRRSALILLVAGLVLAALVVLGGLQPSRAIAAFVCIAGSALVPWQVHDPAASRETALGANPAETAAVHAIVARMPDPNVLLDRAGRVIHFNAAAAQLVPALRRNEFAQFALGSPEIVTALREAIATRERDGRPIGVMSRSIVGSSDRHAVSMPTAFGGVDQCMLLTFARSDTGASVEGMRVDFVADASHELRTPLAALSASLTPARSGP